MATGRDTFGGVTRFSDGSGVFLSLQESLPAGENTAVLTPEGDLRSELRYDLRDELMLCVAMKKEILLDLEKLERISNSCMAVLLEIQQSIDQLGCGSLTLCKVPKEVYRSLDSIGLTDLLMIEE